MIKVCITLLLLTMTAFAKEAQDEHISKFKIKESKRIYYPVKHKTVASTLQYRTIKPNVRTPVKKGFYVEYKKSN